jgi:hypothetical protein
MTAIPLEENRLIFTFLNCIEAVKFDDEKRHGLSHCMSAVDFICEFDDKIVFIEIKDLHQVGVTPERQKKYLERLQSGEIDNALKLKFRDSYLYRLAQEKLSKDIHYYVLLEFDRLDNVARMVRTDRLKRVLPLDGSRFGWVRSLAKVCLVMNIEQWNANIPNIKITIK